MKKTMCFSLVIIMFLMLSACNGTQESDIPNHSGKEDNSIYASENKDTENLQNANRTLEFKAKNIRTDGYIGGMNYPKVLVIRSKQELTDYYEENKQIFGYGREFLNTCDKYSDEYFENQVLILVLVEHGSGSVSDRVTNVVLTADGQMDISIQTYIPEVCTDDMAEWHIFIEPEAGIDIQAEDILINSKSWIKK